MSETVVVTDTPAGVRTVRLNRPEAFNSLDLPTKDALRDALQAAGADAGVRALVITGTGRAFCSGQDIKELLEGDADIATTVDAHYTPIAQAILGASKPVIAALNGTAAGAGLSMALAADLRIMAASAKLTTAFAGIALSCDTGISWTLQRVAGQAVALDLLLRPRPITAEEALRLGLVSEVVPDDQLEARVGELAEQLAAGPTVAYASIKAAVQNAATSDFDGALAFEATKMELTSQTEDHAEAVAAFVAKRPPVFTGR